MKLSRTFVEILFVIPIFLIAFANEPVYAANLNKGEGTWKTSCDLSFGKSLGVAVWGKASLHIAKPCNKLKVQSQWMASGQMSKRTMVPDDQKFKKLMNGQIKNWVWNLSGTPSVVNSWTIAAVPAATAATNTGEQPRHGPRVSWPLLFSHMWAVYRYVLAENPPATQFSIHFFPSQMSIDRTVYSARDSISLAFFIPYDYKSYTSGGEPVSDHLTGKQKAYMRTLQIPCFEYMHALFFSKRLKVPNLLSQSVADSVTCTALKILDLQSDPYYALTLPSVKAMRAMAEKNKVSLLHQGNIDGYGIILATENMGYALGGGTKQVTIHSRDKAKLLKLLKLARAILQHPVDFTKQQLYPIKRLDSIPDYTGTSADISPRH